ncbi:MAG: isochorismatase family protein [Pirellulaceae bacterium]|nr:isochorismatase family protein [Pirellulaceae bacterium]
MFRTISINPFRLFVVCLLLGGTNDLAAQTTMEVRLRSQHESSQSPVGFESTIDRQAWDASETAIIVCDVWDYHHCLNAVRRIEEFAPRLNQVLQAARKQGVTIIHAPSDCMDAYRDHPARQRATGAEKSEKLPADIETWCSQIPSEESANYPIDQSDGGEDDDPVEHAAWAKKLESLGRNPQMPWKKQTEMLTIDPVVDYVSDRGDEVWNILQQHEIENVILVGVHTNMCVLGRPFGLRQMVKADKNVVLMRDMTDTMYNPKSWPYVSHFEGTRRIIDHIERYVCPTISSDQIIGGSEFRFAGDSGKPEPKQAAGDPHREWTVVSVPTQTPDSSPSVQWFRCVVRIPNDWTRQTIRLNFQHSGGLQAWINGNKLAIDDDKSFVVAAADVTPDDANLLVVRAATGAIRVTPMLRSGKQSLSLAGKWQTRIGDDPAYRNIPLPAKFGAGSDIVFAPKPNR